MAPFGRPPFVTLPVVMANPPRSVGPAVPSPAPDPSVDASRVSGRETFSIDSLICDAETYVRAAINDDIIEDYAERLAEGVEFPPIVVFRHGSDHYLADGFHRVSASRRAGRTEIQAEVHRGTRRDALWFALGANRAHGQRLTRKDKTHAVRLALQAWPQLSYARIAAHVGCTRQHVGYVRAQGASTCPLPDRPERVVGVDGKLHRPYTSPASSDHSEAPADPDVSVVARQAPTDPVPARGNDDSSSPLEPSAAESSDSSSPFSANATEAGPEAPSPTSEPEADPTVSSEARPSRHAQDRSERIVSLVAFDAQNLTAQEDLIDFAALDRAKLPGWIAGLEKARRDLDRFIRRLKQDVRDDPVDSSSHDDPASGTASRFGSFRQSVAARLPWRA